MPNIIMLCNERLKPTGDIITELVKHYPSSNELTFVATVGTQNWISNLNWLLARYKNTLGHQVQYYNHGIDTKTYKIPWSTTVDRGKYPMISDDWIQGPAWMNLGQARAAYERVFVDTRKYLNNRKFRTLDEIIVFGSVNSTDYAFTMLQHAAQHQVPVRII